MGDIVIKVENLSKEYRLGTINHGTLKHDLQSWWARIRGKEDPNSIISFSRQFTTNSSGLRDVQNPHFLALKDVSFEVKRGEILGIIGKNGAGKSTLLKVLSQVTSPTKGVVKIKGRIASLLEVGTGFHPELTGRENVYVNGAILGMTKKEIRRKFDEIVDFAEVEKFIDTPVKRYSSGMYVRLAFAVAAHLEPEILIVDEVLAVGDIQFQKKSLGKMGDVAKSGRTVLFVSHNMSAVKSLCTRAILLASGRQILDDTPDNAIKYYLTDLENVKQQGSLKEASRESKAYGQLLRLAAVRLLDEHNAQCPSLEVKKKFSIFIEFNCLEDVKDVSVIVGIDTAIGTSITTIASETHGLFYTFKRGDVARILVHIEDLFLNEGKYKLRVGARKGLIALDLVRQALTFEVINSSPQDNSHFVSFEGLIRCDPKWERIDMFN